ncbi:MAG TPA: hypothetical protein VK395_06765 [Gemmataceae bacterium]|nr:hypothetical protein [Gemmataceae bacterium]
MARKKLTDVEHQISAFLTAVNEEKDFPCVLVATTFLDDALAALLIARLADPDKAKQLIGRGGGIPALESFATRILTAYCMGLIPKRIYTNLDNIREIRNRFAHPQSPIDFGDKEVSDFCDKLILRNRPFAEEDRPAKAFYNTPRKKFTIIANDALAAMILSRKELKRLPIMQEDQ